jgi:hypothetical protein
LGLAKGELSLNMLSKASANTSQLSVMQTLGPSTSSFLRGASSAPESLCEWSPHYILLYTLEHSRLSGIKAMTYLPGIRHPDYLPSVVAEVSGTPLVGQMVYPTSWDKDFAKSFILYECLVFLSLEVKEMLSYRGLEWYSSVVSAQENTFLSY